MHSGYQEPCKNFNERTDLLWYRHLVHNGTERSKIKHLLFCLLYVYTITKYSVTFHLFFDLRSHIQYNNYSK